MSANALMIVQLVIFALLCGVTFLLVWSLAGYVAEKPDVPESRRQSAETTTEQNNQQRQTVQRV